MFRPANLPLVSQTIQEDVMTPSPATPRPSTAPQTQPVKTVNDATTPTRSALGGAPVGQRPLPSSPYPINTQIAEGAPSPKGDNSAASTKSSRRDSGEMDLDGSDDDGADDGAGSDDESVNADGTRSGKKKKSQKFYCTDYPPCNLSFTRSEHLARHIRKHTGERPFQCHCSRRFSRLDNLRQHAQTVHVNEDIPIDSLAATSGSRFQRQFRTERTRQAGNRARASTGGSAGGPIRGHSKSLSTSSIASIGSIGSTYSTASDARRRPPPLVMANPHQHSRPSLDSYRTTDSTYSSYRPHSPSEFSTPTSATFSTGQSSPRWGSGITSPPGTHARSQSMYAPSMRTPDRRLSFSSGTNPFSSPHVPPGRPVFGGANVMNSSNNGVFSPSHGSVMASPAGPSPAAWSGRRDSVSSNPDEAWRRKTWHPDSRHFNSGHNQLNAMVNQAVARPNPPPPIASPPTSNTTLRLPGIESFDSVPRPPAMNPSRRQSSPMLVDAEYGRRPSLQPGGVDVAAPDDRRNQNIYDPGLQRGIPRLEVSVNMSPRDSAGAWASEADKAVQAQAEQAGANTQQSARFPQQPPPALYHEVIPGARHAGHHQHTMSTPVFPTRDDKRHGWQHGPAAVQRTPAPIQQQDPRASRVGRMVHPNLNGFSGFPNRDSAGPQPVTSSDQARNGEPLGRLEALVAVATSESSAATAY